MLYFNLIKLHNVDMQQTSMITIQEMARENRQTSGRLLLTFPRSCQPTSLTQSTSTTG